jgi:hypothetical protein
MAEKVGVVDVRLPWAACEKVLEHGTAEILMLRGLIERIRIGVILRHTGLTLYYIGRFLFEILSISLISSVPAAVS